MNIFARIFGKCKNIFYGASCPLNKDKTVIGTGNVVRCPEKQDVRLIKVILH